MACTYFQKLPRSMLQELKEHRLFEQVAARIRAQVEGVPFVLEPERLRCVPPAAQNVYWLWRFQCEAGVCGMDVFLLNHVGKHAREIHRALREVGASELVHLLEAGIPLARQSSPEFKREGDQAWFDQFLATGEFAELHETNRPAFALMDALSGRVAGYIRANGDALFLD